MIAWIKSLIGQKNPIRLAWHKTRALVAATMYGFPARKLFVIGVSGTDGKTTTVGMIAHILHLNGIPVGACSTAFLRIQDSIEENATHLTSLSPFTLQKLLRKLVREHCTHAVVEMSSHGLVQGRVLFTFPKVAVITNTSLEHLDYHGSMEQYRKDKGIMFTMLKGKGVKVLNATDDSYSLYVSIPSQITLTFGSTESDLHAENIRATSASASANLISKTEGSLQLELHIPGTFNIENSMAALLGAKSAGIPLLDGVRSLKDFTPLPGRMERIDEGQNFSVYVDFAVSPNAYEKTLNALRSSVQPGKRVLVLCSSCGNRMKEKRPLVGKICSDLANVVVVTEDETYGEDPHAVLEEVWKGVDQTKTKALKIFDRRTAIETLFNEAQPGDAVVLCGMGPFSTFTKLEGRIPWDERNVARDILKTLH